MKKIVLFLISMFFTSPSFSASLGPLCGDGSGPDVGNMCWAIYAETEIVSDVTNIAIRNDGDLAEIVAFMFPLFSAEQDVVSAPPSWERFTSNGPDLFGEMFYSFSDTLFPQESLTFSFANFPDVFSFYSFDSQGNSMITGLANPVPEPESLILLLIGLCSLFFIKKLQKKIII